MANKNKETEVQGTEISQETGLELTNQNENSLQSVDAEKLNNLLGLFQMFEEKAANEMRSLTSEYLKMEENKTYNFAFIGMTTFVTDEGEERPAATLLSKDNTQYIAGGAVLVSACKKIKEVPCFVRIITGSKVKTGAGSYLSMEVKPL
jgi:hypothetical protein